MNFQSEKLDPGKKFCSKEDLRQVIINSYDAIFVIDGSGRVILCNPATGRLLDTNSQELIGKNIRNLVKEGLYSRSIALEALELRSVVTGLINNRHGERIMCTATPILDNEGEVVIVVVNSRDHDLVEKYLTALDNESNKAVRYKTAAEYLSEKDIKQNGIVANSDNMKKIIEKCALIAQSDSTIILYGESGTGKEVMARHIHRSSRRVREPFIPVNCAAIPEDLLESEFFGYMPGAFTGASRHGKPGLFEIAHKGTLFLDEIGDLPLSMQSKMLRVIETGEVQRLGGTNIFQTNIRLVAATNRDLQAMVNEKKFRSDLFYRLNVVPIELPPLRERPEDIPVLAEKFLMELNRKYSFKKTLTPQTKKIMMAYHWPGNVRELRNVIERLVVTSTGTQLNFEDDTLVMKKPACEMNLRSSAQTARRYTGTLRDVLKEVEKQYIDQVLGECDGRITEAARRLDIHRTMLYRKKKDFR